MPSVLIIGPDWNLRGGVRAELRERGVEALGMERLDDAATTISTGTVPAAIVVDAECLEAGSAGLEAMARRLPVLVIASRTVALPALPAAAAVLYRPVTVGEIVARVIELLQGQAA